MADEIRSRGIEKRNAGGDVLLQIRIKMFVFDGNDSGEVLTFEFGQLLGGVVQAGAKRNVFVFAIKILEVRGNQAAFGLLQAIKRYQT